MISRYFFYDDECYWAYLEFIDTIDLLQSELSDVRRTKEYML